MVPHAAMHEERVRRQATEKELADERKARQTLEERTNLLLQRIQPAAQPAQQTPAQPEIPDVATDPVGHIVGRMNQQQAVLEQLAQALVTAGQQNQAAQVQASVQQRAAALESDFRAANPEYDAAANYLTDMRNKELVELGWTDPVERRMQIAREALEVADRALKESRNPAEVIMGLAKIRGFAPVAAAEGAANGVAAPAAAAPNAGQRIANAAAGQRQAGTSLSNARGAAPAPITAERLISMNDSEFAEFVANASPAQMRAAMGE
jgi:hypothetical protein